MTERDYRFFGMALGHLGKSLVSLRTNGRLHEVLVFGWEERHRGFVPLDWICPFCSLAPVNLTSLSLGLLGKWDKTYSTELLQVVTGKCFKQDLVCCLVHFGI